VGDDARGVAALRAVPGEDGPRDPGGAAPAPLKSLSFRPMLTFADIALETTIVYVLIWGILFPAFVTGLIIFVACLGKFGGSTLAARACGLGWRESSAIGILMNTRGLMELVILNVGRELGVITDAVFAMMVIMALVTTALTTAMELSAVVCTSEKRTLTRSLPSDENHPSTAIRQAGAPSYNQTPQASNTRTFGW